METRVQTLLKRCSEVTIGQDEKKKGPGFPGPFVELCPEELREGREGVRSGQVKH